MAAHERARDERVYVHLASRRSAEPTDTDYIAYMTGLTTGQVAGALRRLEAPGRIRKDGDGPWIIVA